MVWRLQSYVWCSVLSKAYKQTLIITGSDSITRHSLYWESPQFSLFVSYYGPLTWPHLPKTYFPISAQKHIYLCHLIMCVNIKICNCFTAISTLLFCQICHVTCDMLELTHNSNYTQSTFYIYLLARGILSKGVLFC